MSQTCRICSGSGLRSFDAREMMFGTREPFAYLECDQCGCVQIKDLPPDMQKHYPPSYYSHQSFSGRRPTGFTRILKERRAAVLSSERSPHFLKKWLSSSPYLEWMRESACGPEARILDVGCGAGGLLRKLQRSGYKNLTGVDAFLTKEIVEPGFRLKKVGTQQLESEMFDLVMYHHSFEHMWEPQQELKNAHRVLAPAGRLLVRIPLAGTYAWKHYGTNWVQLDPPRHFYLHTVESFTRLFQEAGFRLKSTIFDSDEFQFWGSELYVRDISLDDPRVARKEIFSAQEMKSFRKQAHELNAQAQGDQACFYLVKE